VFPEIVKEASLCSNSGRLFHARGTATAKARSPIAERHVLGLCLN